jgi:hypothetical protein
VRPSQKKSSFRKKYRIIKKNDDFLPKNCASVRINLARSRIYKEYPNPDRLQWYLGTLWGLAWLRSRSAEDGRTPFETVQSIGGCFGGYCLSMTTKPPLVLDYGRTLPHPSMLQIERAAGPIRAALVFCDYFPASQLGVQWCPFSLRWRTPNSSSICLRKTRTHPSERILCSTPIVRSAFSCAEERR